jgi:antirestriction protein ArdC
MVRYAWPEHAMQCRIQSPLFRMQRRPVVACPFGRLRTPRFLTFKQAVELGGNVRKGEHGTKVYLVKQLQVRGNATDGEAETRASP